MSWQEVLRTDPVMASLIDRFGEITHSPADDEYRRLVVSIINQQLSSASAAAVRERVFTALECEITPGAVLEASTEELRSAGLSEAKVRYLRNTAEAFQDRDLTRTGLAGYSNDEVLAELTSITGIGEWTARMYLMFALGREDVLPLGDLGIRNGIDDLYGDGSEMSRTEMQSVAERWRPYRTYGCRYVWRHYETDEADR
jgi:DNA-3-methyladenine glycosylase II